MGTGLHGMNGENVDQMESGHAAELVRIQPLPMEAIIVKGQQRKPSCAMQVHMSCHRVEANASINIEQCSQQVILLKAEFQTR